MCSFLNTFLQDDKPGHWVAADYTHARFKGFPLSKGTHEYESVKAEFCRQYDGSRSKISEIVRIQHPYAYASYQIRRKQLGAINHTGSIPGEERIYFRLRKFHQLKEFLEYNCDERKATCDSSNFGRLSGTECVVFAKQIKRHSYKTRSSNCYPDYYLKFKSSAVVDNDMSRLFGKLQL